MPRSTRWWIQTPSISRVSIGFGGGGAVFGNKKTADADNLGAGIGSGVRIEPVAFLIVKDGITRVMPVAIPAMNTVDRIVEMVPEVMDRVTGFINDRTKKEAPEPVPPVEETC